jgi:hypothetical protein
LPRKLHANPPAFGLQFPFRHAGLANYALEFGQGIEEVLAVGRELNASVCDFHGQGVSDIDLKFAGRYLRAV